MSTWADDVEPTVKPNIDQIVVAIKRGLCLLYRGLNMLKDIEHDHIVIQFLTYCVFQGRLCRPYLNWLISCCLKT